MRWKYLFFGILIYAATAMSFQQFCASPLSYELKVFGIAVLTAAPSLWIGIAQCTLLLKLTGNKYVLATASLAVLLAVSIALAFVRSDSAETCKKEQELLEKLNQQAGIN